MCQPKNGGNAGVQRAELYEMPNECKLSLTVFGLAFGDNYSKCHLVRIGLLLSIPQCGQRIQKVTGNGLPTRALVRTVATGWRACYVNRCTCFLVPTAHPTPQRQVLSESDHSLSL